MTPRRESFASAVLAVVIGVLSAVAWMNWSVCEQDDRYCLVVGVSK